MVLKNGIWNTLSHLTQRRCKPKRQTMTKKEREYLRSAYLSLQNKIDGRPTTNIAAANRSAKAGAILKEVVFNVLSMAGIRKFIPN